MARHTGLRTTALCLDLGGGQRLAFTTDSFVVHPWRFPGGDIGKLAVCGTVNDLAMAGAVPRYLSCGLILEEGLPFDTLRQVIASMQQAAEEAGVQIVTGDTKVVDRGKGDGIFVNTAGIGVIPAGIDVSPSRVCVGDKVLVSGDLGRHGIAIMSIREGLEFEGAPESDCASLAGLVGELTALGADLHCLRDLTRGGLAAAVIEIAEACSRRHRVERAGDSRPARRARRLRTAGLGSRCTSPTKAGWSRSSPRRPPTAPCRSCSSTRPPPSRRPSAPSPTAHPGSVELRSAFGSGRLLDLLSGEQMPRIC